MARPKKRRGKRKKKAARSGKPSLRKMVREFERRHIENALNATDGNRTHAARRLGMHRTTLIRKIHELKLD